MSLLEAGGLRHSEQSTNVTSWTGTVKVIAFLCQSEVFDVGDRPDYFARGCIRRPNTL